MLSEPSFGLSLPIVVLISMNLGLPLIVFAFSNAASTSSKLSPSSTVNVSKPNAFTLSDTFSVNVMFVLPSIEMLFESYKMMSFSNLSVPASDNASEEIPSIIHPSPANA